MRKLTVYLVGAIRDNKPQDIEWREKAIKAFEPYATILNPLSGKKSDWTFHGVLLSGKTLVYDDFWCVDNADVLVCNFISLADGYPSIGSLIEYGRATGKGKLIYSILARKFKGHETAHFKLHPFLAETSSMIFEDLDYCIEFLTERFKMLSGAEPHFLGGGLS